MQPLPSIEAAFPATLEQFVVILWARKVLFLLLALATIAAITTWAWTAELRYKAEIKLMPREPEESNPALQSLLGQFGGIASLAGLSLGGASSEQEFIAWLKSRRTAEDFIQGNDLLPVLFAAQWDASAGTWSKSIEPEDIPTMDDAWTLFNRQIRRLSQDQKTRLITLEVHWKDRIAAARWANSLVREANQQLRDRAIEEADASLRYLEQQLRKTSVVELQQAIYRLMEMQIKRKLVADSRPDYAFTVIDPATPPDADNYESPRRFLLLIASLPLGLLVGMCGVLLLHVVPRIVKALRHSAAEQTSAN